MEESVKFSIVVWNHAK